VTSRRLLAYLALAIVLAQALGLAHRYVHPAGFMQAVQGHEADAHFAHGHAVHEVARHEHAAQGHGHHDEAHDHEAHDHGDHGNAWLAALLSGHEEGSSCRLVDSVAHDFLVHCGGALVHAVPSFLLLIQLQGEFVARWAALFDARGPPVLR
jgi:hypothetical protein